MTRRSLFYTFCAAPLATLLPIPKPVVKNQLEIALEGMNSVTFDYLRRNGGSDFILCTPQIYTHLKGQGLA